MFSKKWLLALCVLPVLSFGQGEEESVEKQGSLDGGNLSSQYEYMIDESPSYQQYKNIKKNWTVKFGKSLKDSLEVQKTERLETAKYIAEMKENIQSLEQDLLSTKDTLTTTRTTVDSMNWLGMPMQKGSYRSIMWGIIAVLTLGLAVFIVMFKNSNAVTKSTKQMHQDLDEEFTQYKRRSLEREQKLRRDLQDEINKQKGV